MPHWLFRELNGMVCVRPLAQSLVQSMQVVVAVINNSGGAEGAPSLLQHFSEIPHNPHKKVYIQASS